MDSYRYNDVEFGWICVEMVDSWGGKWMWMWMSLVDRDMWIKEWIVVVDVWILWICG